MQNLLDFMRYSKILFRQCLSAGFPLRLSVWNFFRMSNSKHEHSAAQRLMFQESAAPAETGKKILRIAFSTEK
jgi:hypothetical protein